MARQKNKKSSIQTTNILLSDYIYLRQKSSTIQTLLQEGIDIEACDAEGRTPLLLACSGGMKRIADLLIKNGANVDFQCKGDKYTVLHYAALHDWTNIVQEIVMRTVTDLNARNNKGDTAMHLAARSGHSNVVRRLVKLGADINPENHLGFTPLIYAAQRSKKLVFNQLLKFGAKVNGSERLILYYASQNTTWKKTFESFLKRVPDLNKRYVMGETSLDATSSRGHLEVVKLLVEERAGVNREETMICQAALQYASRMGHLEVVEWIIKKGPVMKIVSCINARDYLDLTALHFASDIRHLEIVKCLVEKGADINAKDSNGGTALHRASTNGHLELVKCLLEKEADINTMDVNNETPLFKASKRRHLEVVKLLVEKGADINVRNTWGFTPLLIAAKLKYKDVTDLLIYSVANVVIFEHQYSLLCYASTGGWMDIIQFLIKKGCDVNARNKYGTALFKACFEKQFDIAQTLLQAGASFEITYKWGIHNISLLGYLIKTKEPEFVKLLIENGAYFKPVHYKAILKRPFLEVLQDTKLCCQAIVNKFNNHDLPELYKLPASVRLPSIEKMKIASGNEAAQAIERAVGFDIQANGHCNIVEVRPVVLGVFAVRSVLEYHKIKTLQLKRQAKVFSVNNFQLSRKSRRLS